jgi:methionyl-tRNA synthetase
MKKPKKGAKPSAPAKKSKRAKAATRTAPARKPAAKTKKSSAKAAVAKKATVKKAAAKKTVAKKAVAKKAAPKSASKSTTAKTAAPPRKTTASKPISKPGAKRVVTAPRAESKPAAAPAPKASSRIIKGVTELVEKVVGKGAQAVLETAAKAVTSTALKGAETAGPAPLAAGARSHYYITTAISYPNGAPHIGHAYEAIATDAIARFKRLDGNDVFFLTGTDEHGQKMQQTAAKEGISPRELTNRNAPRFQAMVERLNCSNDAFIRTTEPRHYESSAAIWQRMADAGDIYLSKYAGWYSVRDEAYYAEDETHVNEHNVRLATKTGTPVEWVEEESYFFKLSEYQQKLLDLYEKVPDFVMPKERLNEVASFVRGGLQDLSISRTTFDWGVPVPGDPKHVMYVWVDALTNYITALDFPDTGSKRWKQFWPADLHVIGKDIVRFHAVYWPAFLMSAGIELPRRIFSHGFLFNRGEKMSKSVGNVVDPFTLADAYGVDPLRYFLLREVPFGQDGNYSHDAIVARINADLANDLGNLAQRSLTMVTKAFGGTLPAPGPYGETDKTLLAAADALLGTAREAMKTLQLHQVLNAAWAVVADANRYIASEQPWALAKTDPQRQGTVLYVTAEVIRQVAILAQPVMPTGAAKLLDLLGVPATERDFAWLGGARRIAPGSTLPKPEPVFPRYVEPTADAK